MILEREVGRMKSKVLIYLFIFLSYCCTAINMAKHPDYNYTQTNPTDVRIYDQGLIPQQEFFIIGKMTIDSTWSWGVKQTVKNIQSKAALIGGEGVIITDKNVNIYAFNRGTTTEGTARWTRNQLQYQQTTRDNTLYIPQVILYAYIIKFETQQVVMSYNDKKILMNESDVVYVCITDRVFHKFDFCYLIKGQGFATIPMTLKEALERDYKPCSSCVPIEK